MKHVCTYVRRARAAMRTSRQTFQLAIVCCIVVAVVLVILRSSQSCYQLSHEDTVIAGKLADKSRVSNDAPQVHNAPPTPHASHHTELTPAHRELLILSEHPDIDIRGKSQKTQMQKLCKSHFFINEQRFPNTEESITEFHSHLIFEDGQKIIYCYVPKVGCTNMKRLLLYMSESIPMYTVDWPWVDYARYLVPAMKKASFLNITLKQSGRKSRISNYYKFMIVRNPLERVLSAYRDKLEPPLLSGYETGFPEKIKVEILSRYRPVELKVWQKSVQVRPSNISVTFPEFCRYLVESDSSELNEHFVPSMDICHPCLMQYDFYGNFRNYSTDSAQLVKKFKANPKFYRDESLHTPHDQTRRKLRKYYQMLSQRERVKLFGRLFDELLFYYTLYPSERNSHKEILGINTPVLVW